MGERPIRGAGLDLGVLPYQALFASFPHHLYDLVYCLWITLGTGQAIVVTESGRRAAWRIFIPQLAAGIVMVVVVVVMHIVVMGSCRRQVRDVLDTDVIDVIAGRPVVARDVIREVGCTGGGTGKVRIQDASGNCCRRSASHATVVGLRCTVGALLLLTSDYFVLTIRHRFVAMKQP